MEFAELVKLDSRIGELLREAQSVEPPKGKPFCANAVWYGYQGHQGLKRQVVALVGRCRQDGPNELRTSTAYDTVYQTVYKALPDCKKCLCC